MGTWIALLRGINVGGKNVLKMADLKDNLQSIKLKNVRTYIQSGNVVFESVAKSATTLARKITDIVAEKHGFAPVVVVISANQLLDAIQSNPFAQEAGIAKSLHFFFLKKSCSDPDLQGMEAIKKPSEQFQLLGDVFYLFTPDGFHSSKLAARVERLLGVVTTARNFRTVQKLMDMVDS